MKALDAGVMDEIESGSYELARQALEFFNDWKAGKIYLPKGALRAMGRRYIYLRDKPSLNMLETFEFGKLYAFFTLAYPPDADIPSPAGIAIDFCNLLLSELPTSASMDDGGGE